MTEGCRSATQLCDVYIRFKLTLTLFVALVFGTDNHNFAVSFNNFALVAHRFYRGSYFHN